MSGGKILSLLARIILPFAAGVYLLKNRDNVSVGILSRDRQDPKKTATRLAFFLFGISIAYVPSLLSIILQEYWSDIYTVLFFLAVIVIGCYYEASGKLK